MKILWSIIKGILSIPIVAILLVIFIVPLVLHFATCKWELEKKWDSIKDVYREGIA